MRRQKTGRATVTVTITDESQQGWRDEAMLWPRERLKRVRETATRGRKREVRYTQNEACPDKTRGRLRNREIPKEREKDREREEESESTERERPRY